MYHIRSRETKGFERQFEGKCIMDKREKQVKDRLMNAMLDLSREKEWTKITITDLINRSGVARASFYRNFQTIGDLIQYGVDQIRADFWAAAPPSAGGFLSREMLTYTFDYYLRHRELILSFHHSGMPMNFLDILTESMILSYGDMPASSLDRYGLYYYAGALYNMTICWLSSGARETPAQMAEQYLKFSRGWNVSY